MAYSWIEPKTDWTPADKFTFTDYNRIRNNLLYINEKINTIYPDLYVELDLGEEKTDYTDEYFPSEFNAFEDALLSFERTGKNYNLGERYYHYDNSPFAWDDVLNRLEKCTLRWKKISEIPVTRITVTPHDNKTSLLYIGDTAIFDVLVEPSNATKKDDWVIETVSDKVKLEKINNNQIRATYIKGADVSQFKHGNYPYDELFITHKGDVELTIVAKIDNIKGRCDVGYRPQGSYSNSNDDSENSYYYKFTKIADNVDGRGITTLLMTYSGFKAMPWGYINRDGRTPMPWKQAFIRPFDLTFSLQLKNASQQVTKEVMTSNNSKTSGLSRIELPSYKEFGSENQNVISLGSTYPYLANNELYFNKFDPQNNTTKIVTRSLYDASSSSESNLPPDKRKALMSSRTSSIETVPVDSLQDIYPMIFLQSNLHVEEYHEHYAIDWSGESDLTLADIPLGSIVFDLFGNKGDLSSYKYVEDIVLSRNHISMNKGAIQTVTISTLPIDATYNNKYFNVWSTNERIVGIDYNGDTITIYGRSRGTAKICVLIDEFPNNTFGAEIPVEVNETIAQDIYFVNTGTTTPCDVINAVVRETNNNYDILVQPSDVDTINDLMVSSDDMTKVTVSVLSRSGNRVRLNVRGVSPVSSSDNIYIHATLDGVSVSIKAIVENPYVPADSLSFNSGAGYVRVGEDNYNYKVTVLPSNVSTMDNLVISSSDNTKLRVSIDSIVGNVAKLKITGLDVTISSLVTLTATLDGRTATMRIAVSS